MAAQIQNLPLCGVRQTDLSVGKAVIENVAGGGQVGAVDAFQNRGFSGTGAADNADKLPLLQAEIDVFTGVDLPTGMVQVKVLAQPLDFQYAHMECPLYSTLDVVFPSTSTCVTTG